MSKICSKNSLFMGFVGKIYSLKLDHQPFSRQHSLVV